MMLKSKRLKPNMVDRHIAYIQQEQQKNLARLALYPELVKALNEARGEIDYLATVPRTAYEVDRARLAKAKIQAVLAKAEAIEKGE